MLKIGHRGARAYEPENTLASFRYAVELGVDAIEVDVRKTRDNELVVIHNADVNKTTDGNGPVNSFTLKEIKKFVSDKGEQIPTLEEVLDAMARRVKILIELKELGTEEELINDVSEVVPVLIGYERKAREYLISESENDLRDQVSRAFGTLQSAQQISSEETMLLLSRVRMGVNLKLINEVDIPTVNKLFIHTQPAHLQVLNGSELESTDRNVERAIYLQNHLNPPPGSSPEDN